MALPIREQKYSDLTFEYLDGGLFQYFICFNAPIAQLKPKPTNFKSKNNFVTLPSRLHNAKFVKFNLKPKIHVMHVWNFASKQARRDYWLQVAVDRFCFEKRIEKLSKIITPTLERKRMDIELKEQIKN